MEKTKKIFIGVIIFTLVLTAILVGFWLTGGKSVVMAYQNYLSKDIPDKIYSYQDFRDRGPREMLHGYYATPLDFLCGRCLD